MWFVTTVITITFVVSAICSPTHVPSPALGPLSNATTAISLLSKTSINTNHTRVFVINIYAVKNSTGATPRDLLHDDIINEVPEDNLEPVAMFLLMVEDDNNDTHIMNLDDVAEDLDSEGFTTEKVVKNGTTQIIKVDLNSVKKGIDYKDVSGIRNNTKNIKNDEINGIHDKLSKLRSKRSAFKKQKGYGGGGGGGGGCNTGCCSGCCSGGCSQPTQKVYVVPVKVYKQPQQQRCNPCG